jgi:hypothetical protein
MRCESIQRVMAAYVLGELAPPDRPGIEAHLVSCHQCREAEAVLRRAADALRAQPVLDASPDRRARAVAAMRRGQADRLASPRWQRVLWMMAGRRNRAAVAALFAASLLGIAVARFVLFPAAPSVPPALVAESVHGSVSIERGPQSPAESLASGARLPAGCVVRVGEGGQALLRAADGGRVECRGGSAFRWEPPSTGSGDILMTLYYGSLWCELVPRPRGHYVIRDVRDRRLTVVGTTFEVVCK